MLNPWGLPDLPDACTDWHHDYFETLLDPRAACAAKARAVLKLLNLTDHTLRHAKVRPQTACECGWLTVYHAEDKLRCWMGESAWQFPFNPALRLERCLAVRAKVK